jgi:hypothetical protein
MAEPIILWEMTEYLYSFSVGENLFHYGILVAQGAYRRTEIHGPGRFPG